MNEVRENRSTTTKHLAGRQKSLSFLSSLRKMKHGNKMDEFSSREKRKNKLLERQDGRLQLCDRITQTTGELHGDMVTGNRFLPAWHCTIITLTTDTDTDTTRSLASCT